MFLQGILEACHADVQAVKERDAACDKFLHCILYYKGFHAVQCHRIAHWLWLHNRKVRTARTLLLITVSQAQTLSICSAHVYQAHEQFRQAHGLRVML